MLMITILCLELCIFTAPAPPNLPTCLFRRFKISNQNFLLDLQELLNRVEDFQQHSEKVLADEVPSVAEIQSLLDVSFDFDVELPELPRLRVRLEQARWLEGVQQASAQPATLTLETMRRLIDQGVGLAPHPSVEKAMAHLQELLTVSEHWEDKASSLLKAR